MDAAPVAPYVLARPSGGLPMIRRRWLSLPKLVRFLLVHSANGMALGCAALLVLVRLDLFGVGRLLESDRSGLATAVLFFQTALTFGAVSMAVAVMKFGEGRD
jgi:hypothetical protein